MLFEQLKTTGPIVLALASTLYGMFRSGRKSARLRQDLKENLEVAKLAGEAKADRARDTLYGLVTTQATALAVAESHARRPRDTSSLVTVIFLAVLGGAIMTFCWWMDTIVTDVVFWLVVAFLALFLPIGMISWWTGSSLDRQKDAPSPDVPGGEPEALGAPTSV